MQIDVSGGDETCLMLLEIKSGMRDKSCLFLVVYPVQQS